MKLIEIKIFSIQNIRGEIPINTDCIYSFKLIKEIYSEILKKDKYWHFFYEGDFNLLRCHKQYVYQIEEKLKSLNIRFENCGEWIDDNHYVKKYKGIFLQMFHSFSLIAMQDYSEDDLYPLMDRVIHCFMNHQFLKANPRDFRWEADFVSRYAINRACYDAMLYQNRKNSKK